jgi:hypothetical protein
MWEADAQLRLKKRFDAIATQYQLILETETHARLQLNDGALEEWFNSGGLDSFDEKLRILACSIQELSDLSHPGGSYSKVVTHFTEYSGRLQGGNDGETVETGRSHIGLDFLGLEWRGQVDLVERKLNWCSRALESVGAASAASSLGEVLACHRDLVSSMMQELEIMSTIEREATRIEQGRRKVEIDLILAEEDGAEVPRKAQDRLDRAWR